MRAEDVVLMMDTIDRGGSYTFPIGDGVDLMLNGTTVAVVGADGETLARTTNCRQVQELSAALTTWTQRQVRMIQAAQREKERDIQA